MNKVIAGALVFCCWVVGFFFGFDNNEEVQAQEDALRTLAPLLCLSEHYSKDAEVQRALEEYAAFAQRVPTSGPEPLFAMAFLSAWNAHHGDKASAEKWITEGKRLCRENGRTDCDNGWWVNDSLERFCDNVR